jgi:hypothetical protein
LASILAGSLIELPQRTNQHIAKTAGLPALKNLWGRSELVTRLFFFTRKEVMKC